MARRSIAGSRSLVTGASGGIGRAIALELARQGSSVVACRTARRARWTTLADEIRTAAEQAEAVAGDVTDAAVRRAALDRARAAFGGLDILVNNAGRGAMGRFADASPERLRQVFEVNFFAAAELTREALPLLQQAATGRSWSTSARSSAIAPRRATASIVQASSPCAGLTESLRPELAQLGIDMLLGQPRHDRVGVLRERNEPGRKAAVAGAARASPPKPWREPTVRAIRLGKREIIPSARGRLLVWLNRLAPSAGRSPDAAVWVAS